MTRTSTIEDVLQHVKDNASLYFENNGHLDFEIKKRIWRPYSRVFRIKAVRANKPGYFWVKMFKVPRRFAQMPEKFLKRLETEHRIASQLQAPFQQRDDLNVIKPLFCLPEFGAVATWESPGAPLSELIEKHTRFWREPKDETLFNYARKSGEALALLQNATRSQEKYDPSELIEYVDIRLQRLVANNNAPFTEKNRNMVLGYLEREIVHVPDAECWLCGVHSDFGPFNVLASGDQITVADFTSYKIGSPYVDITYYYHRLAGFLHKPIFKQAVIHKLQQAFISGLGYTEIEQHKMFTLSLLRHTINNFSSLARNRRGGLGSIPRPHIRLFNRRIFASYLNWLEQTCNSTK